MFVACGDGTKDKKDGGDGVETTTEDNTALLTEGKAVYESKGCAACHGANGEGVGAFPALTAYKGSVADASKIIEMGVEGTAMQGYKDQLTPEELKAVSTFYVDGY